MANTVTSAVTKSKHFVFTDAYNWVRSAVGSRPIEPIKSIWQRINRVSLRAPSTRAAHELAEAFEELASRNSALVAGFRSAFESRSKDPSLEECRSDDGLTLTLSGLLRRIPPESYFARSYLQGMDQSHPEASNGRDPAFERKFREALRSVATQYPSTVHLMKKHAGSRGHAELLGGLLSLYVDSKSVYPY